MNPILAAFLSILLFIGLFIVPFFAARFVARKLGGSLANSRRGQTEVVLSCSRCDSGNIECLQSDGVSPFPGYTCRECRLQMRPDRTGKYYALVLVLSVGLETVP